MKPGEIIVKDTEIIINKGKPKTVIPVKNEGDRPVQVGSHYHFFEVNDALKFDRELAYGKHLDIPAGASVRFEPGDEKEVQLIEYGGRRHIYGFKNKVDGPIDESRVHKASFDHQDDKDEHSNKNKESGYKK
ncbi:urease subunit beta [Staphylococcus canis]|uniref:Urease subunit beta n=1 Tax=Staphylococcus canis TaxID=2724942 RepID=A0ABS0T856_9STAP|nr:urease subunit beta [Staphylococcus canis]MBI5974948.1 urease subunit beta [Staphylococcus canis]